MIILDTWAWIEFLKGSEKGEKIKSIIENNEIYTSAISIAEISKWVDQNKLEVNERIEKIKQNSKIIYLEETTLIESGKKYNELRKIKKNIGLIDVIIYTTSLLYNLILVTNDEDFSNLPNVQRI